MPKFYVTVVNKSYYTVTVEAENQDKAQEDFNWDNVNWLKPDYMESEIEDIMKIKEDKQNAVI